MMDVGTMALPEGGWKLSDQFGRAVDLGAARGRHHVLLCFYPLDFTPT